MVKRIWESLFSCICTVSKYRNVVCTDVPLSFGGPDILKLELGPKNYSFFYQITGIYNRRLLNLFEMCCVVANITAKLVSSN